MLKDNLLNWAMGALGTLIMFMLIGIDQDVEVTADKVVDNAQHLAVIENEITHIEAEIEELDDAVEQQLEYAKR